MLTNSYISVVSPAGSVFISPFGSVLTNFNSTTSLTCNAQGGPNNMFVWRRQGMIVSNSSVLELTMITGSDGGVYECTVTNDAGSDMNSATVIGMCYSYKSTFSVKKVWPSKVESYLEVNVISNKKIYVLLKYGALHTEHFNTTLDTI